MKYRQALEGYRVLEFTQFIAGPTAGRMLAELGAEVIKLEFAPGGDYGRAFYNFKQQRSAFWVQHNRGKKSLCLNPKTAAGRELMQDLIARSDVFVENFSPGTMGRLGLGWEDVKRLNPRCVMCSISAFGQDGPMALHPGYDMMAGALSGVFAMQGEAEGPPVRPGVSAGDINTGVAAVAAIGYALLHRERSGEGQFLDISLLDVYFHCHDQNVVMYNASGHGIVPARTGNHWPQFCPCGLFKSREGYIAINCGNEGQWASMSRAMGRPELASDPRFATNESRSSNQTQLIPIIEQWLATLPDSEALTLLQAARVPATPVLTVPQALEHPQLRAHGTITRVKDPVYGELDLPRSPLRMSAFEDLELQAPFLGEHNDSVLSAVLGYAPERIAALKAEGIVQSYQR